MNIGEKESVNALIYKANTLLKFYLQDCLRQFDITSEQWPILRILYYNSGQYNQKELADKRLKEPAAMMRILNLMEKKNYVERRESVNDNREYILYITDQGTQLYKQTLPHVEKSLEIIDTILTGEEILILKKLLGKLIETLSHSK